MILYKIVIIELKFNDYKLQKKQKLYCMHVIFILQYKNLKTDF